MKGIPIPKEIMSIIPKTFQTFQISPATHMNMNHMRTDWAGPKTLPIKTLIIINQWTSIHMVVMITIKIMTLKCIMMNGLKNAPKMNQRIWMTLPKKSFRGILINLKDKVFT